MSEWRLKTEAEMNSNWEENKMSFTCAGCITDSVRVYRCCCVLWPSRRVDMCHWHHQRLRPRAPVKVKLWGTGAVHGPCITGGRANSPFHGLRGDARITRWERGADTAEYSSSVHHRSAASKWSVCSWGRSLGMREVSGRGAAHVNGTPQYSQKTGGREQII